MQLRISFLLSIVCFSFASAQIGTGQWRMHVSASKAIDLAIGNGLIMTALESGVLEYDVAASENKLYNDLNGLSDIAVNCITYEPTTKSFFVGYKNGNIDQINGNGTVTNIPGIQLAQITGNKTINKLIANNGLVYAATGFSIVVIDPVKQEIKDTYYPGNASEGINDIVFLNDSIFGLSNSQLFKGRANNPFLADAAQWFLDPRIPVPSNAHYASLAVQEQELHFLFKKDGFGGDSILRLSPSGLTAQIGTAFDMEITNFHVEDDLFYVYYDNAAILYNENSSVSNSVNFYSATAANPKKVLKFDNYLWIADNQRGLVRYIDQNLYTFIQREGPPKNEFFSLNANKDKVLVTGGIIDRVQFAYSLAGAYTFQEESWKGFEKSSQSAWTNANIWDIGVGAVNPIDVNKIALGGYCIDALSLVEGDQVDELYNATNSPLQASSLGNGNVCLSALEYDEAGNLWMTNCFSNKPLKVLMADGTWKTMETGTETNNAFTGKLAIDYNGNKWFAVYNKGLLGFNDNETPDITTDDSYKLLRNGAGIGNLPSENVTAIAVDFDNEIWIGTDAGLAVLYNSDGIFENNSNYDASQILVNFDGNVEVLLGETPITDIEVDGGNRKWIGTASTGIFLLSADGQEVITQFTEENSPLISNNIMDMEFNQITGELFIITDQGLVSLRTDATYEDPEYATTAVFPNPVKPDYFGPITIQGIRYNSDVKITDVAGNLVYKTTSNGGTATWNGKTLNGENVASGVYLIWTAMNEQKDKKVGKVVVIR